MLRGVFVYYVALYEIDYNIACIIVHQVVKNTPSS
jgi:hypothetical protein